MAALRRGPIIRTREIMGDQTSSELKRKVGSPFTRRMRLSPTSLKSSASSSRWLNRQKQDPYVRARASDVYVSRAAFKLEELQALYHGALIRPGMNIVDLGAAPGGWLQVASRLLCGKGSLVGVDLLPLAASVSTASSFVQGNFLDPQTRLKVLSALDSSQQRCVDLVLSDMLANTSGNPTRDNEDSFELCKGVLRFALAHLRIDSGARVKTPVLVMKSLQSFESQELKKLLSKYFATVAWKKPRSSRKESREGYWVCGGLIKDRLPILSQ